MSATYVPPPPEPERRSLRGFLSNLRGDGSTVGQTLPRALWHATMGLASELNLPLNVIETMRDPSRLDDGNPFSGTTELGGEVLRSLATETAPNVAALALRGVDAMQPGQQGPIADWARERSSQALTEYYEAPISDFLLRDVGNVAVAGTGIGAVGAGVARGAGAAATRATARGATGAAARRSTVAQTAQGFSDAGFQVLARPYRSTARGVLDADLPRLGTLRGGLTEFADSRTPGRMAHAGAKPGELSSPYAKMLERVSDTKLVSRSGASKVIDNTVANTRNLVHTLQTQLNQRYTRGGQDFSPESRIQRVYHSLRAASKHDPEINALDLDIPSWRQRATRTFEQDTMVRMYDALNRLEVEGKHLPPGNRMTPELVNRTKIDLYERIHNMEPGALLNQVSDQVILGTVRIGQGTERRAVSEMLLDAQRALRNRPDYNTPPPFAAGERVVVTQGEGLTLGQIDSITDESVAVRILSEGPEGTNLPPGSVVEVDRSLVKPASLADQVEATFPLDLAASEAALNANISQMPTEIQNAVRREVDNVRTWVARQEAERFNVLGESFGGERIHRVTHEDGSVSAVPMGAGEVRPAARTGLPPDEAASLLRQNTNLGREISRVKKRQKFLDERGTARQVDLVSDLDRLNRELDTLGRRLGSETDAARYGDLLAEQRAAQAQIQKMLDDANISTPEALTRANDRLNQSFTALQDVLENPSLLRELTPQHAARLQDLYSQLDDVISVALNEPSLLMTPIRVGGKDTTVLGALNMRQAGLDGLGRRIANLEMNPQYMRQMDDLVEGVRQTLADYKTAPVQRHLAVRASAEQTKARIKMAQLGQMERQLDTLSRKLDEALDQAMWSREAASAPDRTYLRVAREVGPDADRLLRDQAIALNDPNLAVLADQLDLASLPNTIEAMLDAGVDPTYLKSMPARGVSFDNRGMRRADVEMRRARDLDVIQHQMQHETAARILKEETWSTIESTYGRSVEQVLVEDTGLLTKGEYDSFMAQGARGRTEIDRMLSEAGWKGMNRTEMFGLPETGPPPGQVVPPVQRGAATPEAPTGSTKGQSRLAEGTTTSSTDNLLRYQEDGIWDDVLDHLGSPEGRALVEDIRANGIREPIEVYVSPGNATGAGANRAIIADGHHRLAAAQELGITEVPVRITHRHPDGNLDTTLGGQSPYWEQGTAGTPAAAQRPPAQAAADAAQGPNLPQKLVPQHIADSMRLYKDQNLLERFLLGVWQPYATGVWRASVLALRPMWHVNNAIGGFFLTQTAGNMTPASYLRFMPQAVSEYRRIRQGFKLTPEDGLYGARLDDLFESSLAQQFSPRNLGRSGQLTSTDRVRRAEMAAARPGQSPDDLASGIGNAFSEERALARRGAAQRAGREGHDRPQLWAQAYRDAKALTNQGIQASYRANSFVDNVHRAAVYLNDTIARGKTIDEAITHAVRTMGDYQALTPAERVYMRSIYPFYSWARHMFFVGARMMKPDNIQHTLMQLQLAQIIGEPNAIEQMLPSYAQGDIYLGDNEDGQQMFLGTSGFNVFRGAQSPFSWQAIHPLAQVGIEQYTGVSMFTRRPFSSPTDELDEMGRPLPNTPSWGRHLAEQFPQYRLGDGLQRWARGDWNPRYDTGEPMVFDGVNPANPLYRDVLGQFFPPIRTMDLEDIEQRVDFREQTEAVRQQRYEQQRQQYQEGLRRFSAPTG